MIKPLPISGFFENLPEAQIVEEEYKNIIKKNYSLAGFTPIETPSVERVETLKSKGGDDSEIYGIHRLNGEISDDVSLGLRFDLTVPLARYVAQNEGVLSFPFKRQQIQKSFRGERPQKGRFREFYQADIDIIANGNLPLFADVEILQTIYFALKELNFGAFSMNINNKKLLVGFLDSLHIKDIVKTIGIIDKKDKVRNISELFQEIGLSEDQIASIFEFIKLEKKYSNRELLDHFMGLNVTNDLLIEGAKELEYVYNNLIALGVEEDFIKINPSISRGLNYYTGTVYETFIVGNEKVGSISSGGRYENLCSNFTKNNYPGVGGSIGLSRLLYVLDDMKRLEKNRFTITQILVVNMGEADLPGNLEIVRYLREKNINTELYLDSGAKLGKQFKYADNKKIPYVIVYGENERKLGTIQVKNIDTGEQKDMKLEDVLSYIS